MRQLITRIKPSITQLVFIKYCIQNVLWLPLFMKGSLIWPTTRKEYQIVSVTHSLCTGIVLRIWWTNHRSISIFIRVALTEQFIRIRPFWTSFIFILFIQFLLIYFLFVAILIVTFFGLIWIAFRFVLWISTRKTFNNTCWL